MTQATGVSQGSFSDRASHLRAFPVSRFALCCALLSLGMVLDPESARAQTSADEPPAAAAEQQGAATAEQQSVATGQLAESAIEPAGSSDQGDIIVTAQRRSERLVDVPMSIVAESSESLQKAGVLSIQEISQVAPGVQFNFNGGFSNPSIRGISALTNGKGFDNNVAVFVDGIYVPDMITVNADFGNVESIQVLKGPQGALYGRNATGGAILITTRAPSDHFTGNVRGSYAEFDEKMLAGYLSGPIADGLSFSAAVYRRWGDGYIRLSNPTTVGGPTVGNASPQDQRNVRLKLQWKPSDAVTATLGYNYALNQDNRGNLYTPIEFAPASLGAPPLYSAVPTQKSYNSPNISRGIANEYSLGVEIDTGIGILTSHTGIGRRDYTLFFDFDGTYNNLTLIDTGGKIDSEQQTLIFSSSKIKGLDIVIGGEYYHEKRYGGPNSATGHPDGGSITLVNGIPVAEQIASSKGNALAAFVDATFHATDKLSITAGGRYSYEKKTGFFSSQTAAQFGTSNYTFPPTSKEESWDAITPRASVRYEVAPNANVYAAYSQGFRAGAWSSSGAPTPALFLPLDPEKATSYEVGFKIARRSVRFEAAGFLSNYRDIHIGSAIPDPFCVPPGPCTIRILTLNGPKARIYGIDASLEVAVTERFNVRASGAWLHARYLDFPNAVGTGLNTTTGLNVPSQIQDWTGKQMARAPEFSGNLGADYTIPVSFGSFRLSGNAAILTSHALSNPSLYGPLAGPALAGKQRYRTDGYTLVNGEIAWLSASGSFEAALFVRNLFDARYRGAYSGLNNGDYGFYGAPRVIGVRAGYNF